MSLKMVPNETCCCQILSYLCAYQVCLGDVRQCWRQWGGVAIYRGKLGVANHLCRLPSCCLQLGFSDNTQKSSCSARTQKKLFPCYKGKLMFFYPFFSSPLYTACSCLVAHPRGSYATVCIPLACFALGSKDCVKANVNY